LINILLINFYMEVYMCMGGSKPDDGAARAEEARRQEAARLAELKRQEEAKILADTLESKTSQANKESQAAKDKAKFQVASGEKTALEDPESVKKKSLLSNYSGN
jgi:hypothetical protein